jgi:uncharacterized membrane protein YedE/YeeE
MNAFLIAIAGILFGFGLVFSGMTNPDKVIGFLDVTGEWQPALAFVMGGALAVFGTGLWILKKRQGTVCGNPLPDTSSEPIRKSMAIGAGVFGIGWGLGGICPGPAFANLTAFHPEILIFIPLMIIGMIVAQRIFQLDQ